MSKTPLVIATVSWARTKKERAVILRTLKSLAELGYPVIVTDELRSKFPIFGHKDIDPRIRCLSGIGMVSRARRSWQEALRYGARHIFYIESDKFDFAENQARAFVSEFLRRKNKNCVLVPVRTNRSFQKYPPYQQYMEKFLWQSFSSLTGERRLLDITYGPRIFPAFITRFDSRSRYLTGFGWQMYLSVIASRLKLKHCGISFDFSPPADIHQGKKLILYRMQQLEQCLLGMREAMKVRIY